MEVSPSRVRSIPPIKGIGNALTQWEDLKSWQTRQEALFVQSSVARNQVKTRVANQLPTDLEPHKFAMPSLDAGLLSARVEPSTKSCTQYLDLSVIQEVDEDTRTTVDLTTIDDEAPPSPSPAGLAYPRLPLSAPALRIVPGATGPKIDQPRPPPMTMPGEPAKKVPSRPFLRRGQGLVRFNLHPDEALRPYRGSKTPSAGASKPARSCVRPAVPKTVEADCPIALSRLRLRREPQKAESAAPPVKTWSHLLAQDLDEGKSTCGGHGISGIRAMQEGDGRHRLLGSPKRSGTLRGGAASSPEVTFYGALLCFSKGVSFRATRRGQIRAVGGGQIRAVGGGQIRAVGGGDRFTQSVISWVTVERGMDDEESLAAYIALEQHVGNTSFCSTSSMVDRLIAKSCRSRQLAESPHRHSGFRSAREVPTQQLQQPTLESDLQRESAVAHGQTSATDDRDSDCADRSAARTSANLEDEWEAEDEEIRRRIRGVSGAVEEADDAEFLSEAETETEAESSEAEDEVELSTPRNPVKAADLTSLNGAFDVSSASVDFVIESINRKVEEHLKRLCFEIDTLQKSNATSKNQVKTLKKQVRQVERKLAAEHLSYERKLAEEREVAASALAEEKARAAKEKMNFERFCREQKKKEASPVLLEQVESLRKDMVSREESWRAERAKARGIECNLRIQITNLKKENEKLKADNSKLRREKETAVNAAKAKTVSNTKVINAIAQHLSKAKPQVIVTKENAVPRTGAGAGADPKANKTRGVIPSKAPEGRPAQVQPTIGVFPGLSEPAEKAVDWSSSDEEIDLGPRTPEKLKERLENALSNSDGLDVNSLSESLIAETQAKYEALFNGGGDLADFESVKSGASNRKDGDVVVHPDGSVERRRGNGTSVVTLPDGTQKRYGKNGSVMTVPLSGWPILVAYFNGDKQERHEDGTVHYFYAKTQTWQTTHPDGREELRLPNGVVGEKKSNGFRTVTIPAERDSKPAETENTAATEGTRGGRTETVVLLPNGDKEIRTKDYVERRFKDGTVRFLYNDGTQKTVYTSGRIRVKDGDGRLLLDTAANENR